MGAIDGAIGQGLGIATGVLEGNVQQHFNSQNQALQIQGQKEMGRFNQEMALDMWNKTNYGAQMKHMTDAGLNVGLMYGKGAGGGATAQTQAGNVSGQQTKIDTSKGMSMMLQNEAIQSQIEVNKSQTAKAGAETEEIKARTPTYQKGMEKTDSEIQEIATRLNVNIEQAKKIIQEVTESQSRIPVNEMQVQKGGAEVNKIGAEIKNINANTGKIGAEINKINTEIWRIQELTGPEKDKITSEIEKMAKEVELHGNEVDIHKFKAEIEALRPGMFGLISEQFNQVLNWARKLKGEDKEYEEQKTKVKYR